MKTNETTLTLLREMHVEVAISIGAVVEVFADQIPDRAVWQLTESLGALFQHQSRRLGFEVKKCPDQLRPHPAVLQLIQEISRTQTSAGATSNER